MFTRIAMIAVTFTLAANAWAAPPATAPATRIGTYSSRAVALAYYRSDAGTREANQLHEEANKAKAAGDQRRLDELKVQGESGQHLRHFQVFGEYPIHDVMQKLKDVVARVAQQAGVAAVVPDVDWHDPAVEVVDVTDAIVATCKPSPQTLKMVQQIRSQPPVALRDLLNMKATD